MRDGWRTAEVGGIGRAKKKATELNIEEARQRAFAAELCGVVSLALGRTKMADERTNSLGRLNNVLFDELERLNEIDVSDEDATKSEIERSRAIEGTAKAIIENSKTILTATRMRAEFGMGVDVPKLLEG